MGKENLIPITQRSKEEARKISQKGGIASGIARKKKKKLKDVCEMLLNLPLKDEKIKKKLKELGINDSFLDNQTAMSLMLLKKAVSGDVKAFEVIRDTTGQKEPDRVITENGPVNELIKSIDELKSK